MEIELLSAVGWSVYLFGPHDYLRECLEDLGDMWGMSHTAMGETGSITLCGQQ
jgi:hypothetical protein